MRGDQLARQWRLLVYLGNSSIGRRLSQIVEELECSERNARRDLAALTQAGFAIYQEKNGQTTVWKMSDAFRQNPPIPMDTMEVVALLLAESECRHSNDFIAHNLSTITEKILRSRPPEFRQQMELLQERFYGGATAQPQPRNTMAESIYETITQAITGNRIVSISYQSASGDRSTSRRLNPLHVWTVNNSRYLVAHCHKANALRTFHFNRILKAEILKEKFEPDPSFDMHKHAMQTFGVFHAEPEKIHIQLDPVLKTYIIDHPLHPAQSVETTPVGIDVHLHVGVNESLISRIMGFGSLARVLTPHRLAILVIEKHRAAVQSYNEPLPGHVDELSLEFD